VDIDISKPADNVLEFYVARSQAIAAYADVERAMMVLLSSLLKTDIESAAIIFFRITNSKSRSEIIRSLLKKQFGTAYSHYWFGIHGTPNKRGLMSLIGELDGKRNEIVHWHEADNINIEPGGTQTKLRTLIPPNFWQASTQSAITVGHLITFRDKCFFVHDSISQFVLMISEQTGYRLTPAWRDTFQSPCIWPPPQSHPLYKNS
jgi:hypothetical protein